MQVANMTLIKSLLYCLPYTDFLKYVPLTAQEYHSCIINKTVRTEEKNEALINTVGVLNVNSIRGVSGIKLAKLGHLGCLLEVLELHQCSK